MEMPSSHTPSGNPLNLDTRTFETLKWSAVWYAVAQGIPSIVSQIAPRFTGGWVGERARVYGVQVGGGFQLGMVLNDVIWGAVYGAIIGFLLSKFYDKIIEWNKQYLKGKLNTFFKLLFYPALVGSLLGFVLVAGSLSIFTGIVPFVLGFGGALLANYIYAKMMTKYVGIYYGSPV